MTVSVLVMRFTSSARVEHAIQPKPGGETGNLNWPRLSGATGSDTLGTIGAMPQGRYRLSLAGLTLQGLHLVASITTES